MPIARSTSKERARVRHRDAPRRVPRALRERQMIDAAAGLFAERGYHAVSMDAIAQAAGVSKPMVYAYFESKEGLFLACVERATEHLIEGVEQATPPHLPNDERMWRGLLAVFTFIEEHREAWALLYPDGPPSGGPFFAGAHRASEAMAALLTRLLRDAAVASGVDPDVAEEETEPIARALVAAVEGLGSWWVRNPTAPKELQALRLMNLIWMGLGNTVRGNLWLPPAPA